MSFYVEDKGGSFESAPVGSHLARCYRVVDLGTQKSEYQGQVKYLRKVMLGWEIHGKNDDGSPLLTRDGKQFGIFKNYTLSWSDKATLRIDLQAWRGRPFSAEEMRRFDLKTILGAWCMLNVIERQGTDGKMYVNVANISPVPAMIKQAGLPTAVNKNEMFNLSEPDWTMFETFTENLKKKIINSPEFAEAKAPPSAKMTTTVDAAGEMDSDDIPF